MTDSDSLSPKTRPSLSQDDEDEIPSMPGHSFRQYRAKVGKRLSGRPPVNASNTSLQSLVSQSSAENISKLDLNTVLEGDGSTDTKDNSNHDSAHHYEGLVAQVSAWVQSEKDKRASRKARRRARKSHTHKSTGHGASADQHQGDQTEESDDSVEGLEKLEQILSQNLHLGHHRTRPSLSRARRGSRLFRRGSSSYYKLKRGSHASSDTDYFDGDVLVPSCGEILDNSKTMSYSGGAPSEGGSITSHKRATKERDAWNSFKAEILRLAHTLRLKGWRRVPLDYGEGLDVERLSGALTNAVYVVSPPKNLPDDTTGMSESTASFGRKRPVPKLLLRIYGPQVEHLIDRENELQILKRLARQNIGPKLLGTFENGRFEEYYHAITLTAADLRVPDTSMQIAKRMRELHDGIELLEEERDKGPFLWNNWDKWVDRCEQVISFVDRQILKDPKKKDEVSDAWKDRGLICGVEWSVFRKAVEKYRAWLDEQYGGPAAVRDRLVFAHNDTQYGNILRLEPSGQSPLLLPANAHKRLVVIDFEYASANLPALEFANHFTEWCYNYHDSERSYALNHTKYPTLEEQKRFLRSYIEHHSPRSRSTLTTPLLSAADAGPSSSISSFMLESRYGAAQAPEEEPQVDLEVERRIERLVLETRLWRVANSAQWVAWAIVQAKVPEMGEDPKEEDTQATSNPTKPGDAADALADAKIDLPTGVVADTLCKSPVSEEPPSVPVKEAAAEPAVDEEPEEEEFDYLSYARERAMLFWGDIIQMGVVKREELPEELWPYLKIVRE